MPLHAGSTYCAVHDHEQHLLSCALTDSCASLVQGKRYQSETCFLLQVVPPRHHTGRLLVLLLPARHQEASSQLLPTTTVAYPAVMPHLEAENHVAGTQGHAATLSLQQPNTLATYKGCHGTTLASKSKHLWSTTQAKRSTTWCASTNSACCHATQYLYQTVGVEPCCRQPCHACTRLKHSM